jgi:hypothetical protein
MKETSRRLLVRNLIFELVIYGAMLLVYFFAVLRFLGGFLTQLFNERLILYSFVGLGLIVIQAVFLEAITSFLLRMLRLDRLT